MHKLRNSLSQSTYYPFNIFFMLPINSTKHTDFISNKKHSVSYEKKCFPIKCFKIRHSFRSWGLIVMKIPIVISWSMGWALKFLLKWEALLCIYQQDALTFSTWENDYLTSSLRNHGLLLRLTSAWDSAPKRRTSNAWDLLSGNINYH